MKKQCMLVSEGDIFYKWATGRIKRNKNVISATTGATGSGKSFNDLRKAEIHYRNFFNEPFPMENCCFFVAELMNRISKGNLRKGEILILEEAGVNSGSQDWQNKIVKMFNYILQAFRSLNIILFMNLPVLSMLSKQARQLIHIHLETTGIDFINNRVTIKPLVHQLNQHTGKSYWKYMRMNEKKRKVAVKRLTYNMPSPELILKYEEKKKRFLKGMTDDFIQELDKRDKKKIDARALEEEKNELSPRQKQAYELLIKGFNDLEASKMMNVDYSYVGALRRRIEKKMGIKLSKVIPNPPTLSS